MFGLHRRERIEVQAILKTAKKQPQHDMQTNAHTHTCGFNAKMPEGLSKRSSIYRRDGHFFKDFDAGAQGGPKEAAKLPKDGPGTPNGRPRVHKCLKSVWKWNPKVTKS